MEDKKARHYIVDGQSMTISEIARKFDLEDGIKYLHLLAKKSNHDEHCIEEYLKRNNYMPV